MTAFARVGDFDFELFEVLERQLVRRLAQADGATAVTAFAAHSALAQDVIRQCLIEKKQKRRFWTLFKKVR